MTYRESAIDPSLEEALRKEIDALKREIKVLKGDLRPYSKELHEHKGCPVCKFPGTETFYDRSSKEYVPYVNIHYIPTSGSFFWRKTEYLLFWCQKCGFKTKMEMPPELTRIS